jgi:CcmD family protein
MKRLLILMVCSLPLLVFAQETTGSVEMADTFREEGKIYVVVAVIVTILLGTGYYLWTLDRKISKLEKELRERKEEV